MRNDDFQFQYFNEVCAIVIYHLLFNFFLISWKPFERGIVSLSHISLFLGSIVLQPRCRAQQLNEQLKGGTKIFNSNFQTVQKTLLNNTIIKICHNIFTLWASHLYILLPARVIAMCAERTPSRPGNGFPLIVLTANHNNSCRSPFMK